MFTSAIHTCTHTLEHHYCEVKNELTTPNTKAAMKTGISNGMVQTQRMLQIPQQAVQNTLVSIDSFRVGGSLVLDSALGSLVVASPSALASLVIASASALAFLAFFVYMGSCRIQVEVHC